MRGKLQAVGQQSKKGLLFYGLPGTGKTHTIQYLASSLEGYTTLLVTAEQVCLLHEYFSLARLLQPSILVIEDADLIALDEALNELAKFDERKAKIVELKFFGGLSVEEIAEVLRVAPITVMREWKKAKACR